MFVSKVLMPTMPVSDLSPSAFSMIGAKNKGVLNVKWSFMN
jgi:expansin (peptidoglycan-binding protein)